MVFAGRQRSSVNGRGKGIDRDNPTFELRVVSPHSSIRHLEQTVADMTEALLGSLVGLWGRGDSRL